MNEEKEIIEMALCEVPHIFLLPNRLYRFVVMPDCEDCARLASVYADEDVEVIPKKP